MLRLRKMLPLLLIAIICYLGVNNNRIVAATENVAAASDGQEVEVNEANFPDDVFREYILSFDRDGDGCLTGYEISDVTYMSGDRKNISSFVGIEFFYNLENFHCECSLVSSLDVSHNLKLKTIVCNDTNLTELDVSNNPNLTALYCDSTNITYLDLRNNPRIEYLRTDRDVTVVTSENGNPIPTVVTSTPTPTPFYMSDPDGVGGFVYRLYDMTLERVPDWDGYNSWVNQLRPEYSYMEPDIDGGKCAYGFFFSDEFIARSVSDEEYVTILYRVFFNREPDAAGANYWINKLTEGEPREAVFVGFVGSQEWKSLCESYGIEPGIPWSIWNNDTGVVAFVKSLYLDCLGREADAAGLNDWVNKLTTGQITGKQAAYGFFFSQEYFDRCGSLERSKYIKIYYRVFLNRDADQAGIDYWLDRTSSASYFYNIVLFDGFADSSEFAQKCQNNGVIPGEHINVVVSSDSPITRWCLSTASGGRQWSSLYEYVATDYETQYSLRPAFPYVFGGLSPVTGIDCSGLIVYALNANYGVNPPHYMYSLAKDYGITIDPAQAQPGDLVCDYDDPHGWAHIYVGRVGPDATGRYHDYIFNGTYGDDEGKTWTPRIVELANGDGWEAYPVLIEDWPSLSDEYRIARVPR